MRELGLDFGFVHARFHKPAHAQETLAGEFAGGLDGVNFICDFTARSSCMSGASRW